ncbi:MAG: nuclear transport factor 2 family protein [Alphaproteobacteria bacterium]|nr:nuclear transport factor 2 family protein [Alphaproteobacteria bacterium]
MNLYSSVCGAIRLMMLASAFALCIFAPKNVLAASNAASDVLEKQSNFSAKAPDESAVIDVLSKIGKAEEDRKLDALEPLLAPNFEHRQSVQPEKVQVAKRDEYIAARKNWGTDDKSNLTKITNIQNIAIHPKGELASATAFATYKYRNFSPRYLETYNFEKIGGAWKLLHLIQIPLHPTKPEQFEVQFLLLPKIDIAKEIARLSEGNADAVVEEWKAKSLSYVKDGSYSYVAVFRESPPVGTNVRFSIQRIGKSGQNNFHVRDKIVASTPFYIIADSIEISLMVHSGVEASLAVNDQTVAKIIY